MWEQAAWDCLAKVCTGMKAELRNFATDPCQVNAK